MYDTQMDKKIRLPVTGFLLTLAAALVGMLAPLSTEVSSSASGTSETVRHLNLVQSAGWGVALRLAIPVVVVLVIVGLTGAAIHLGHRRRAILLTGAVLLGIWTVLSLASVGLLYVPATVVMIVAAVRAGDQPPTAAPLVTNVVT
jgi:hypothetical protein